MPKGRIKKALAGNCWDCFSYQEAVAAEMRVPRMQWLNSEAAFRLTYLRLKFNYNIVLEIGASFTNEN